MKPLDETTKRRILETRAGVSSEDIEEYERLQSQRFRRDPSVQPSVFAEVAMLEDKESDSQRLAELAEKLFGSKTG